MTHREVSDAQLRDLIIARMEEERELPFYIGSYYVCSWCGYNAYPHGTLWVLTDELSLCQPCYEQFSAVEGEFTTKGLLT